MGWKEYRWWNKGRALATTSRCIIINKLLKTYILNKLMLNFIRIYTISLKKQLHTLCVCVCAYRSKKYINALLSFIKSFLIGSTNFYLFFN